MILIANWKQNFTVNDIHEWFTDFIGKREEFYLSTHTDLVLAPSYPLIYPAKELVQNFQMDFKIASQDLSDYEKGPHTGEVSAFQIEEMVEYTILGHSERREMGESSEKVGRKAKLAIKYGIKPIVCFSTLDELDKTMKAGVNESNSLFAYEPVESIGTGNSASVSSIDEVFSKSGLTEMIYGGSVNNESIKPYLELDILSGFLVGGASLDPKVFRSMLTMVDNNRR